MAGHDFAIRKTKRRNPRVQYGKVQYLNFGHEQVLAGPAQDISNSGLFVRCDTNVAWLREEQPCALMVDLQGETVEIPARVVRVAPDGVAIRFVDEGG